MNARSFADIGQFEELKKAAITGYKAKTTSSK